MFQYWPVASFVSLYFRTAQAEGTTSSSLPVTTTKVAVGANGHLFTPEVITAAVGDIIEFQFYPLNHSVARSDYKQPCIPYEFTGPSRSGFWSGFRPLAVVATTPPTFQVRVNDTNPIFFYCSAPDACTDGMVGVINPNATQTLDVQKMFAANASYDFSPGENFPAEGSASRSSVLAGATATGVPQTTAAPAAHGHSNISPGAIAGIAIGSVALCLLAGAMIYLCGRQRTISELVHVQQHQKGEHGEKGQLSPGSSRYSAKAVDGLGVNPHSNQNDQYDRSTTESENPKSKYLARLEHGNFASRNTTAHKYMSPVSVTQQQSPTTIYGPRSEDNNFSRYQPMTVSSDVPPGLRINRETSQYGLHELAGEGRMPEMREQAPPYAYEKQ